VEEIGRTRPTTVAELIEEANRFANGEDAQIKGIKYKG
jgi:hypothetical protein